MKVNPTTMSKRKSLCSSSSLFPPIDDFACLLLMQKKQYQTFAPFLLTMLSSVLCESSYYIFFKNECVPFLESNMILILFVFFMDSDIINVLIKAQKFKITVLDEKPHIMLTDDMFPPLPPLRRTKHVDYSALLSPGESGLFKIVKNENNKEINYYFLERIPHDDKEKNYWGIVYIMKHNLSTNTYDLCHYDLVPNHTETEYISYDLITKVEPIKYTP